MVKKYWFAIVAITALAISGSAADGQTFNTVSYGYGAQSTRGGHHSSGFYGGWYSPNCGRDITTQEAAQLWSSYCYDDCSFNHGCGGGCGCGLFRCLGRLFGCGGGCGSGCGHFGGGLQGCGVDGGYVGGCGTDGGYVNSGCGVDAPVSNGCGVDSPVAMGCGVDAAGPGCGGCGHGCGLFRRLGGLFGRCRCGHAGLLRGNAGGCGCCCYQGCFGYPSGGGCCGGCGGHSGRLGCGCGIFGATRSATCGAIRGVGRFAHGLTHRLFSCCRLHRVGRYGCNGGYFYDAPFDSSHSFGFYSAGCGGCDGGATIPYSAGQTVVQPTPVSQHDCNSNGCNLPAVPQGAPVENSLNPAGSFSPAGDVIPGQVTSDPPPAAVN